MNQVSEILGDKGRDVLKIDAEASALDAVRQMVGANIGSLLVTDGGEVTGIVTERDYLRRVAQEGPTDDSVTVRDIMSSPLIVVSPETEVDECMAVMTDRRIRHLPVVENGDVVGIVSIGDVVKFKSRQQSFEIRYLTDSDGSLLAMWERHAVLFAIEGPEDEILVMRGRPHGTVSPDWAAPPSVATSATVTVFAPWKKKSTPAATATTSTESARSVLRGGPDRAPRESWRSRSMRRLLSRSSSCLLSTAIRNPSARRRS